PALPGLLGQLGAEATSAVIDQGIAPSEVCIRRRMIALRLAGQESTITIDIASADPTDLQATLQKSFHKRYTTLYGYPPPSRAVEVESVRVVASSKPLPEGGVGVGSFEPRSTQGRTNPSQASSGKGLPSTRRESLQPIQPIPGPALITEPHATTVV